MSTVAILLSSYHRSEWIFSWGAHISIQNKLEKLRTERELTCVIIIDGEGNIIAQVGETPEGEEFALYSLMVMETTRCMSLCGGFGEPVCNGVILTRGRILITHQATVKDEVIYTSLLCHKVPGGLLGLLNEITSYVEEAI